MPTEESLVARFEKIQKELGSPLDSKLYTRDPGSSHSS